MQNIAIFMDKPDEGRKSSRWRRKSADCGRFEQISDRIVRRHGETGSILRLLLCSCDLALLDEPFVGLDRDLMRYFGRHAGGKIERQGMACIAGNARPLRSRTEPGEIMLLSTKGMNVQTITLPTPLSERDWL